jgi:hypothetical protein
MGGIDGVKHLLTQVNQDAKQLVHLTNVRLLQPSAMTLLDELPTGCATRFTFL